MKVRLIQIGKTEEPYLHQGIQKYTLRLSYYCGFEIITVPGVKNKEMNHPEKSKKKETESVLKQVGAKDYLVLLDEKGKEYTSLAFAQYLDRFNPMGHLAHYESISFVIGGPFGFDALLVSKAHDFLSLSQMTFSHQMIRLFFVEQLYRAFSILKNEPYHHV